MADPGELDAILDEARRTRRRASRATWGVALLVGALGLAGFVAALTVDGASTTTAPTTRAAPSLGFVSGLAIGLVVGLALGLAIARRRAA